MGRHQAFLGPLPTRSYPGTVTLRCDCPVHVAGGGPRGRVLLPPPQPCPPQPSVPVTNGPGWCRGRKGWVEAASGPLQGCGSRPVLLRATILAGLPVAWRHRRFALPTASHCPLRPRCVSGWSEGWPAARRGCWWPSRPDAPRVLRREGCFSTLTRSVKHLHVMKLRGAGVEG